jgi:alkaline phosphatase D
MSSSATFKIIVTSSQALNLNNQYEGWHHFAREQQAFLDWLAKQNVPGVMLMSGDRHFSTLLKLEREGRYPLYELTCSPTTANAFQSPGKEIDNNDRIVAGTVVTQANFCELEVTGKRGNRTLNLSVRDLTGTLLWERPLEEKALRGTGQ